MRNTIRYAKPSITNLPPELGAEIFRQILSTPVPDRKKLREESNKILKEMVALREREIFAAASK